MARVKVDVLMIKSNLPASSGSPAAHESPPRKQMSAREAEASALGASLCCEGGVLPQIDWSSVVLEVKETRQGKLSKVMEFAVDMYIVAPGEHVHVAWAWHQFKDFWKLLKKVANAFLLQYLLASPAAADSLTTAWNGAGWCADNSESNSTFGRGR